MQHHQLVKPVPSSSYHSFHAVIWDSQWAEGGGRPSAMHSSTNRPCEWFFRYVVAPKLLREGGMGDWRWFQKTAQVLPFVPSGSSSNFPGWPMMHQEIHNGEWCRQCFPGLGVSLRRAPMIIYTDWSTSVMTSGDTQYWSISKLLGASIDKAWTTEMPSLCDTCYSKSPPKNATVAQSSANPANRCLY